MNRDTKALLLGLAVATLLSVAGCASVWWQVQALRGEVRASGFVPTIPQPIEVSMSLVRARVTFSATNPSRSRTLVVEGATYADVKSTVDATQSALATEWGATVTVTWDTP